MRPAEELAQLWAAEELDVRAIEAVSTSAWKTYQLVYFLDKILQKSPLPPGEKKWVVSSRLEGDRRSLPGDARPRWLRGMGRRVDGSPGQGARRRRDAGARASAGGAGNRKAWCSWSPHLVQVILPSSPGYDAI